MKITWFFIGLGAISTTPLVTIFAQREQINYLGNNRLISDNQEIPRVEEEPKNDVLKEAISIIKDQDGAKESKMGCFWVPNFPGTEIFFCFDTENKNVSPFLFHYSWKGSKPMNEKLHLVEGITSTKAYFQGGNFSNISLALKPHLSWTYRWKPMLKPKEHCKMVKDGENYKLNCDLPDNSGEIPTWFRDISKSIVVSPNKELQQKI